MSKKNKKQKNKAKGKKLALRITAVVFSFALAVMGVLQLGCLYTRLTWEAYRPDYPKVDLISVLEKAKLTDADYELLYRQTGLTKLGIDGYLEKGDKQGILNTQQFFFEDYEVITDCFNIFTYDETIRAHAPIANLETGDILVTSTTRVSWWRYGHAALVVDGEKKVILESIAPGIDSKLNYASEFADLANFLVLRPKLTAETKQAVVRYAIDEMRGMPYGMTRGVLSKKYPETLKTTQCAHLVWYAYKKFGVDLDSNGGGIVKPQDMALSKHVEVVQAYGFDLDTLWS